MSGCQRWQVCAALGVAALLWLGLAGDWTEAKPNRGATYPLWRPGGDGSLTIVAPSEETYSRGGNGADRPAPVASRPKRPSLAEMMAPDYTKRYERRISELYDQRSAEPPSLRQDPLVAVCMVGNARTLPIERVYRSIKRNFLESTSKNTYLFAHLKLWDTNTKVQPKHGGFSSVPTTLTSLEKALQYLDPIELKIETSQPVDSPLNPSCQLTRSAAKRLKTTDFFVGKYESRFVGQMQSVHDCYQSVVSFEQRAGIRFDAVAKIRPDAVWFYPSHSAQELIGLNDLKIVTHLTDQFIFSPRKFSEGYSSFWRNYTACKGEWTGAYFPEDAYKFAFEGEGAVYWNQRRTPQVLRRGDRNQPSAAINCGRQRRVTNLTKCMLMVYGLP